MPGLSLIAAPNLPEKKADQSFAQLLHRDKFKIEPVIITPSLRAAFCGSDGYPRRIIDKPDMTILIEGMIYNFNDQKIEAGLMHIAESFSNNTDYHSAVASFMKEADGDYLVLIWLKDKNKLLFFNDRWGRLPIYFYHDNQTLALSREVKFNLDWAIKLQFDPFAIAEFLTLEYILGDKTFFKDIHRLHPASIIMAAIKQDSVETMVNDRLIPVSYQFYNRKLSRRKAAGAYLELFRQSLTDRVGRLEEKNLLLTADLSGGYDTRAVFAGLCEIGADFTAYTDRLVTGDETPIARQLARHYGKDIQIINAAHPIEDISEMTRLLYITDGLVNGMIDTSCFYDDLEREKKIPGPYVTFKGMGGEFIRSVYMPKKGYSHLADAVMDDGYNHYMSIADACSLLSMNRKDLHDSLKNEIDRFGETDPIAQTRHLFFDYNNKTVCNGEDRNRMFSWVAAPMWGNQLFTFATQNIPPKYLDHNFFALFLRLLSPKAMDIPMYGSGVKFNAPMSRILFNNKMRMKKIFRDNRRLFKFGSKLRTKIRPVNYIEAENTRIGDQINRIYNESNTVRSCFNGESILNYVNSRPERLHLYQLLTIILYMTEVEKRHGDKLV